jgi:hypothetical protein
MFCEPSKSHNNTVQIGGWPWGALAPLASEFARLARDAPSAARGDHLKRVALFYQRPASESGIRLFLDFASRSRSHEAAVSARCASGSKPEWLWRLRCLQRLPFAFLCAHVVSSRCTVRFSALRSLTSLPSRRAAWRSSVPRQIAYRNFPGGCHSFEAGVPSL